MTDKATDWPLIETSMTAWREWQQAEPVIDISLLGDYDAMVVMRSRDTELCFVMKKDMEEEAFHKVCSRLRELVFNGQGDGGQEQQPHPEPPRTA